MKKSSIKLIEKSIDPSVKGIFERNTGYDEFIFLQLYLAKKFSNILHYIPFTELTILDNTVHNKISLVLIDYNNGFAESFGDEKSVYKNYFTKYKKTKKRFTLFLAVQITETYYTEHVYHAIMFLYDSKYNEIELFDSAHQNFNRYKPLIKNFFTSMYGNELKIIYPHLPKVFKDLGTDRCSHFLYKSPIGFCVAWTLWFIDYRLTNPNKTRHLILKNAKTEFDKGDKICRVIIGYAMFIDNFLKFYKLDVDENRGYAKIIDTRTNKKYNIPKKIL